MPVKAPNARESLPVGFTVRYPRPKKRAFTDRRRVWFPSRILLEDESLRMDHPSDTSDMSSRNAQNASAFETFDSVDEAHKEVYGLKESSTIDGRRRCVTRAYASVTRESTRARLRAFEQVDDLRAENAALRAVVTRR